jgi:hypothetical protein
MDGHRQVRDDGFLAAGVFMSRSAKAGFCVLACAVTVANASELVVGASTIQKIIAEQLFNKHARWYLSENGPCYAYLEAPHTQLKQGRLLLNAHLSARIGVDVGGNCLGSGFASNVTLSGRLVGKASTLTLDDIRIDHADDDATRAVFDLIQDAAPQALPRVLKLDVLDAVRGTPISTAGVVVSVTQFRIIDVATQSDAVVIHYDLSLSTP